MIVFFKTPNFSYGFFSFYQNTNYLFTDMFLVCFKISIE